MGGGSSRSKAVAPSGLNPSIEIVDSNASTGEGFRWTCNNCESENPINTYDCLNCGLGRGQADDGHTDTWKRESPEPGSLPVPESDNSENERRKSSNVSYKPPTPLPEDQLWICAICNFENPLNYRKCRICGAEKTENMTTDHYEKSGQSSEDEGDKIRSRKDESDRHKKKSGRSRSEKEPSGRSRAEKQKSQKSRSSENGNRDHSEKERSSRRRSKSHHSSPTKSPETRTRNNQDSEKRRAKSKSAEPRSKHKEKKVKNNASYLRDTAASKTRFSAEGKERNKRRSK